MSMTLREKTVNVLTAVFFLAISSLFLFILFRNLGTSSVINYDEARHGISAYEMLQTGNWIENTFMYQKDLWNLKPPLSFWAEALAMKLVGYNILAFRLPSALSLMILFFTLAWFLLKNYGKTAAACFMVLFTAFDDFFFAHFGRSGDADALYVLFYFAALLCVFQYGQKNGKRSNLYLACFFAALAFLTKSFHAAVLYLSIILYLFVMRKTRKTEWKTWLIAALCASVPILLWAVWRYSFDGLTFLGSMFSTDVTERVDSYNKNIWTYVQWLGTIVFYWMPRIFAVVLLSSLSVMLLYRRNEKETHNTAVSFWAICIVSSFVPFVIATAKIHWYFFPFLILLCVVASIAFGKALPLSFTAVRNKSGVMKKSYCAAVMLLWSAVFGYSCLNISRNIQKADQLKLDPIQQALIELPGSRETEYSKKDAYVMRSDPREGNPENWEQADILVAELYGDFHCQYGGVSKFLENPGSVLYMTKDYFESYRELTEYPVIAENDRYVLLENPEA